MDKGPARATRDKSLRPFLKFLLSMGTGFAQPIKPVSTMTMVPIISRWAKGLRVTLPLFLAVSSPNIEATQAWANSWTVRAKSMAGIKIARSEILILPAKSIFANT
ncbi:MAG: hypothetical protein LBU69_04210 [Deltaproteobacteria bacterium]|nr:hypothetical protein [Deltaproteobacteria bacterium]